MYFFFLNKAPGISLEHLCHQILTQKLPQSMFSVPFINAQAFFFFLIVSAVIFQAEELSQNKSREVFCQITHM